MSVCQYYFIIFLKHFGWGCLKMFKSLNIIFNTPIYTHIHIQIHHHNMRRTIFFHWVFLSDCNREARLTTPKQPGITVLHFKWFDCRIDFQSFEAIFEHTNSNLFQCLRMPDSVIIIEPLFKIVLWCFNVAPPFLVVIRRWNN